MLASLRRSASASAAMAVNSLPRWLISITDIPASCQLTSSHFAFSSTSTGMVAGPAPKLKMRARGLLCGAAAIAVPFRVGFAGFGRRSAMRAVGVGAVAVLAVLLVAIHDALQARELLALVQVDQRDPLG